MKVSYRWLQEFVEIPWSAQELADRLTMAGLEVESVESIAPALDQVVVGEIEEITVHPNADSLNVCQICVGEERKTIVCGAPNVAVGMKVPVALEGVILPNGMQIKSVDLRGVKSYGMACSEVELAVGDDASGLMVLPSESPVGHSVSAALGLDDLVLDVSIYANRPDCMSMIGIAREVAALLGTRITYPNVNLVESNLPIEELASITVEAQEKCPRYSARLLQNIEIGPSPQWIQQKLRAAGMRPINNVVDITNFVMLETGQPLHAFDYDQLAEHRIVVRTALDGEELITLDGEKRSLTKDMLMICDANQSACIAGVMGGENSEVTESTTSILLESANFAAANIRRTSRRLGILSEAAARFEKGIDPHGTLLALNRAADLLHRYAAAQVAKGVLDVNHVTSHKQTVELSPKRVNQLLGTDIPEQEMISMLTSLELVIDDSSAPWQVTVPSFRQDIELECDLIEEVARLWGFDNVPVTLPSGLTSQGSTSVTQRRCDLLRTTLVGAGLSEAINYSFVHPKNIERVGLKDVERYSRQIPLQHPLTEDYSVMRTTLIPGLLDCASRNLSRQQQRVNLFELGAVYIPEKLPLQAQPREQRYLSLLLTGPRQKSHWDVKAENYDFYDLKGYVELVLSQFSGEFVWECGEFPVFHPNRQGQIRLGKQVVGGYGEIHPRVQKEYRIVERVYVAEIDLDTLLQFPKKTSLFMALPKFPAVDRDMALLLADDVQVADVVNTLQLAGGELLKKVEVFDVYQGAQVSQGMKSVAFSFIFQGNHTLTDEVVNQQMKLMYQSVQQKYKAEIRN